MRKINLHPGIFYFAVLLLFILPVNLIAQPVLRYDTYITGLSAPVDIVNAGDGSNRLFIVQQRGVIKIHNVTTNTTLATPFLDITTLLSTGSEQGLLSLAFYPNYEHPDSAYFFIYYTNLAGDIVLARYQPTANPNIANTTGVILLTIPKPFANHNGGKLNFGPDGFLYFGTGDGGSGNDPGNRAQNGNSLLGKMLRIDVKNMSLAGYTIPPTNPYVGPDGILDEIWALGLRNPWRWSFDRATGNMFIGDVGQNRWEEINYRPAGSTGGVNYGWRCYEGSETNTAISPLPCTPSTTPVIFPQYEYFHDNTTGGFSIVGGYVYRGTVPGNASMRGYYIFNDTYRPNTWLMNTNVAGFTTTRQPGLQNGISTFGEDEAGELYVASLFSNTVYKVMVNIPVPLRLISFSGKQFNNYNEIKWRTGEEEDLTRFVIEYSSNGADYQVAGEVIALNQPEGHSYIFRHTITNAGKLFYRLRAEENSGKVNYSPVVIIGAHERTPTKLYPTIITDGQLHLESGNTINKVSIYNSSGLLVYAKEMMGISGYFQLSLPGLPAGIYLLRLNNRDGVETHKIMVR